MIITHGMIMNDLQAYKNPKAKLGRLVAEGKYTQIVRGLFETEPGVPGYLLAGSIYGPSYLSFEFALAYHGLIPERVTTYTSATFGKNRSKFYDTPFGCFTYHDIPEKVYPLGIMLVTENGYAYQIAAAEKALCDKLYTMHPAGTQGEMLRLLEEDLRIDPDALAAFDLESVKLLADGYHSTNVALLYKLLRRMKK